MPQEVACAEDLISKNISTTIKNGVVLMSCKGNFYVARSDLQVYVHLLNNTHNLTLTRCKDFGGSDLCAIISRLQM